MEHREDRVYRLAALDMDGTLLNSRHEISPFTRDVLRRAAEAGRVVALSTGRCLSELREHLADNPHIRYVIGENGACVYDALACRFIRHITLPAEAADRVLTASAGFDACRQAFLDNQSYMERAEDPTLARYHIDDFMGVFRAGSEFVDDLNARCRGASAPPEKINLYFADARERDRFLPLLDGLPLKLSDSIGIGLEISPREATKAAGLEALCAHLDIPLAEVMAVGDGSNDVDIMGAAGLSVAMGNALPEVRRLADAFTEDCDHDGAARAILRHMGLKMPV